MAQIYGRSEENAEETAAAAKAEVLCALREKRRDDIRRIAASGSHGLVCRECREKAWPFLLGVTSTEPLSKRKINAHPVSFHSNHIFLHRST